MNGIDELERMLESRSTDYGRMRQILAFYKMGVDKSLADLRKRGTKYEFAVRWQDGTVANNMGEDLHSAECIVRDVGSDKAKLVRREVGEWEEVKKPPKRPLANGCCAHNPWGYSKPFSIGFGKTPEEIAETFEKMKEARK